MRPSQNNEELLQLINGSMAQLAPYRPVPKPLERMDLRLFDLGHFMKF